jgi:hypothetical protein
MAGEPAAPLGRVWAELTDSILDSSYEERPAADPELADRTKGLVGKRRRARAVRVGADPTIRRLGALTRRLDGDRAMVTVGAQPAAHVERC